MNIKRDIHIMGADEVGRGAFAGPVVAAAVVFPQELEDQWKADKASFPVIIRDSKKMSALQRAKSAEWIYENAIAFGIGEGSCEMINSAGIVPATFFAFRMAIENVVVVQQIAIQKLYVDGHKVPQIDHLIQGSQEAFVRGEDRFASIAAASIIAKVYRDNLMNFLSKRPRFSSYQWHKNKGYGTLEHRNAIREHGICDLHRTQFVRSSFTRSSFPTRS